jgi:dTDP-4-dehydrorhamnose reductase
MRPTGRVVQGCKEASSNGPDRLTRGRLELWGGLECTVARIGQDFRDQVLDTGHRDRIGDLDRIARLGIRTLRYPVLWETISPEHPDAADFLWHDERLKCLRDLGIRVIAGLCHHGSGPAYTHMLDPAWPELLARHAARVAGRYPHLDLYTPVNEPLTTARFSGLYGHWYPHRTGYETFLKALVNQCKATVLAMRAIRTVRTDAQLVQTDDLGKTFSTPLLAYQAEHENQRRWLSFDLLCGRVDRDHPWWRILQDHGIEQSDLELFLEGDAAPDIVGVNHYLTSERYLDERLSHYPEHHHGGNGRHRYADAEAVRMPLQADDLGPKARLHEVWERYRRPVAVTEVHHGCTRDEQLRWLIEVWNAAEDLRAGGADIRAVTVWSLFGTVDWNSLLTRRDSCYEPGPYDVRGPEPRRTALAHAAESLATTGTYDHPVLDRTGWWKRDSRFYRPREPTSNACRLVRAPRRILVIGATGMLAHGLSRVADLRGLDHALLSRDEIGSTGPDGLRAAIDQVRPWAVVHAPRWLDAPRPEEGRDFDCHGDMRAGEAIALACAERGLPLVTFSSDLVFDGALGRAYGEADAPCPICPIGALAAAAESLVLAVHEHALVVRAGPCFGPWDRTNFVWSILNELAMDGAVKAGPELVSPTYVPDLAHVAFDLLIDGAYGLWHLTNPGALSRHHFIRRVAEKAGLDPAAVALRPEDGTLNRALTSERGVLLPPLDSAIDRYLRESEIAWDERDIPAVAAE